jgi:hypothetical protein
MRFRPHSVDCDQQLGAIRDPVRGPVMAQARGKARLSREGMFRRSEMKRRVAATLMPMPIATSPTA